MNKIKKRLFGLIISLSMLISVIAPNVVYAAEVTLDLANGAITIDGANYKQGDQDAKPYSSADSIIITGKYPAVKGPAIQITGGTPNIILDGVNIDLSSKDEPGIDVRGDSTHPIITVKAETTNTIMAGDQASAIQGGAEASITINGTGALVVVGGQFGAGIGTPVGGVNNNPEPTALQMKLLSIDGTKITAQGGTAGAGIGTAAFGHVAKIEIKNADITAFGGAYGAGIGPGANAVASEINIENSKIGENSTIGARGGDGAAAIGTGATLASYPKKPSKIDSLNIKNSEIVAVGGGSAAGIGTANMQGVDPASTLGIGTLNIEGGKITALGGNFGAGIGTGSDGKIDVISITNVTDIYNIIGGANAAAIGSGDGGEIGTLTIKNIKTENGIQVVGQNGSAAIGTGNSGKIGTLTIEDTKAVAKGGFFAAAIGTGFSKDGKENEIGTLTIKNSSILAKSEDATLGDGTKIAGAGTGIGTGLIDGGKSNKIGKLNIIGGEITAIGGNPAPILSTGLTKSGAGIGKGAEGKMTYTEDGVEKSSVTGIEINISEKPIIKAIGYEEAISKDSLVSNDTTILMGNFKDNFTEVNNYISVFNVKEDAKPEGDITLNNFYKSFALTTTPGDHRIKVKPEVEGATYSTYKGKAIDDDKFVIEFDAEADKLTAYVDLQEATVVKVTFDADNETEKVTKEIIKGDVAVAPANPVKTDAIKTYEFKQWELVAGTAYDFATVVNEDITLKAAYDEKVTVTFEASENGSLEGTTSVDVIKGSLFSTITVPTLKAAPGYEFDKWDPALPAGETAVNEAATYTASFKKIEVPSKPEKPATPSKPEGPATPGGPGPVNPAGQGPSGRLPKTGEAGNPNDFISLLAIGFLMISGVVIRKKHFNK